MHDDLRVGDTVTRTARIAEVAVKEGNSGALCWVTVENRIAVDGRKVLTDIEEIVYLPDGGPSGLAGPARNRPAAAPGARRGLCGRAQRHGKALARAFRWRKQLTEGVHRTIGGPSPTPGRQRSLRQPRLAADAVGAGHRRSHPGRAPADGDAAR